MFLAKLLPEGSEIFIGSALFIYFFDKLKTYIAESAES